MDIELNKLKDKNNKKNMRFDICKIQLSNSESIFKKSTELFEKKWLDLYPQSSDFIKYFNDNWVTKKNGWYEGYSIGDPSQSNSIESSHKDMKAFSNIKQRHPCIRFLHSKGKEMLEEWSKQRSDKFGDIINPNVEIYQQKIGPMHLNGILTILVL